MQLLIDFHPHKRAFVGSSAPGLSWPISRDRPNMGRYGFVPMYGPGYGLDFHLVQGGAMLGSTRYGSSSRPAGTIERPAQGSIAHMVVCCSLAHTDVSAVFRMYLEWKVLATIQGALLLLQTHHSALTCIAMYI